MKTVVCDICGSSTVLDPSSAAELLTRESVNDQPSLDSMKPRRSQIESERPLKNVSKAHTEYGKEYNCCNSHPDENVTYFCFDCLTPPVCSECVVHGIHRNHDVMHVKKSYPVIKEKLDGTIQGLGNCIDGLEGDRKALSNRKEILIHQGEEAKGQLKGLIDDLISRIEKKESELMNQIDLATNDSLRELESYERIIDDKLNTLENNVKYIKENMASGLLGTLNFYADNNKLLTQVTEQESQKNDRFTVELMTTNTPTPDNILMEVKNAANYAVEAVNRMKISSNRRKTNRSDENIYGRSSSEYGQY